MSRGDRLRFNGVRIVMWWPPREVASSSALSENERSVGLRSRFGEKSFLLVGDIERTAEAALVAAESDLHCDVVKVAHHGSRSSSTLPFVTAAHASYAIIPVGLSSPFNHPHQEVVERWRASGAQVLTTGVYGTVTVSTDGHDLKLTTFVPN